MKILKQILCMAMIALAFACSSDDNEEEVIPTTVKKLPSEIIGDSIMVQLTYNASNQLSFLYIEEITESTTSIIKSYITYSNNQITQVVDSVYNTNGDIGFTQAVLYPNDTTIELASENRKRVISLNKWELPDTITTLANNEVVNSLVYLYDEKGRVLNEPRSANRYDTIYTYENPTNVIKYSLTPKWYVNLYLRRLLMIADGVKATYEFDQDDYPIKAILEAENEEFQIKYTIIE